MKELAARHGAEAVNKLVWLMRRGADERTQLAAARELLDRGFGKPAQAIGAHIGGGPVLVRFETTYEAAPAELKDVTPSRAAPLLEGVDVLAIDTGVPRAEETPDQFIWPRRGGGI